MFQLDLYETEDGKQPVADFLESLEPQMAAKLVGLMLILRGHYTFFTLENKLL